jgi:hypothetical protein
MAVEIALGALAIAAVKCVVPYLEEIGKGAAKKTGEETANVGFKLLGWMREKLTGRAKEALEDLEKEPLSGDNQADLRKSIAKQLEAQPQLLEELESLVPAEAKAAAHQEMNQSGNDNRGVQVSGSGNWTNVS